MAESGKKPEPQLTDRILCLMQRHNQQREDAQRERETELEVLHKVFEVVCRESQQALDSGGEHATPRQYNDDRTERPTKNRRRDMLAMGDDERKANLTGSDHREGGDRHGSSGQRIHSTSIRGRIREQRYNIEHDEIADTAAENSSWRRRRGAMLGAIPTPQPPPGLEDLDSGRGSGTDRRNATRLVSSEDWDNIGHVAREWLRLDGKRRRQKARRYRRTKQRREETTAAAATLRVIRCCEDGAADAMRWYGADAQLHWQQQCGQHWQQYRGHAQHLPQECRRLYGAFGDDMCMNLHEFHL